MDERMLRPGTTRLAPGAHAAVARSLGDRAGETEAARGTHEVLCAAFGHPAGQALVPRLVSLLDAPGLRSRQVRHPGRGARWACWSGSASRTARRSTHGCARTFPTCWSASSRRRSGSAPRCPARRRASAAWTAHHSAADPAWPLLVTQYSSASSEDRAMAPRNRLDPLLAAIGLAWAARDRTSTVDGRRPGPPRSTSADDLEHDRDPDLAATPRLRLRTTRRRSLVGCAGTTGHRLVSIVSDGTQ